MDQKKKRICVYEFAKEEFPVIYTFDDKIIENDPIEYNMSSIGAGNIPKRR